MDSFSPGHVFFNADFKEEKMNVGGINSQFAVNAMQGKFGGRPDGMIAQKFDQMISSNDSDGDGSLSIAELGISENLFTKMDSDGDGLIKAEELKAGLDQFRESVKNGTASDDEFKELIDKLGLPDPEEMRGMRGGMKGPKGPMGPGGPGGPGGKGGNGGGPPTGTGAYQVNVSDLISQLFASEDATQESYNLEGLLMSYFA